MSTKVLDLFFYIVLFLNILQKYRTTGIESFAIGSKALANRPNFDFSFIGTGLALKARLHIFDILVTKTLKC